jgi:hypothetical protein
MKILAKLLSFFKKKKPLTVVTPIEWQINVRYLNNGDRVFKVKL